LTPELDSLIRSSADEIGIPHDVALRQLGQESSYKSNAVSPKGARGFAQFMPGTAARYGVDVNDPVSSIQGWKRYMSDLLGMFKGDLSLALAGYNAGEGAVKKYGGIPPYRETQDYVQKILGGTPVQQQPRGGGFLQQLEQQVRTKRPKGQVTQPAAQAPVQPQAPTQNRMAGARVEGEVSSIASSARPSLGESIAASSAFNPGAAAVTRGVVGGVGGFLGMIGSGIRYGNIPVLVAEDIYDVATGRDNPRPTTAMAQPFYKAEDWLKGKQEEMRALAPAPRNAVERFGLALNEGIGSTGVQLPALVAGGEVLGAANLPLQMAMQRGREGTKGMARGFGEGMVYHFGMGLTAPLGRVANALIWGTAATGQGLAEGAELPEALAGGLNMGALSTMGPERVKVRDAKTGTVRPATARDLIPIQRGKIEVLPPSYLESKLAPMRGPKDSDVLSGAEVKSRAQKIEAIRAQRAARVQSISGETLVPKEPTSPAARAEAEAAAKQVEAETPESIRIREQGQTWTEDPTPPSESYSEWSKRTAAELQKKYPTATVLQTEDGRGLEAADLVRGATAVHRAKVYETIKYPSFEAGKEPSSAAPVASPLEQPARPEVSGEVVEQTKSAQVTVKSMGDGRFAPYINGKPMEYSAPGQVKSYVGKEKALATGRAMFDAHPEWYQSKAATEQIKPELQKKKFSAQQDYEIRDALEQYDPNMPIGFDEIAPEGTTVPEAQLTYRAERLRSSSEEEPLYIVDPDKAAPPELRAEIASDPELGSAVTYLRQVFEDARAKIQASWGGNEYMQGLYKDTKFGGITLGWHKGVHSPGEGSFVNPFASVREAIRLFNNGTLAEDALPKYVARDWIASTIHELTHTELPHAPKPDRMFELALKENLQLSRSILKQHRENLIGLLERGGESFYEKLITYDKRISNERTRAFERRRTGLSGADNAQLKQSSSTQGTPGYGEPRGSELREGLAGSEERVSKPSASIFQERKFNLEDPAEREQHERLTEFMGPKSIFKRSDGSFQELYHGTTKDFEAFKLNGDLGIHFGTSKAAVDRITESIDSVAVRGEGYERRASSTERQTGVLEQWPGRPKEALVAKKPLNVLPTYVRIENPVTLPDLGNFAAPLGVAKALADAGVFTEPDIQQIRSVYRKTEGGPKAQQAAAMGVVRAKLQEMGYDGVRYKNASEDPGSISYIALDPTQVKSAIGNLGTYDQFNSSILHAADPISLGIKGIVESGKLLMKGVQSFKDWNTRMTIMHGPGIRPHLRALWDMALGKFISDDIIGASKKIARGLLDTKDTFQRYLAPASRGPSALRAAMIVRERSAVEDRRLNHAIYAVEDGRKLLETLSVPERYDLIDKIELGQIDQLPDHLQPVARTMRRLNDEATAMIQRHGKLKEAIENYFGHLWKDPAKATELYQDLMRKQSSTRPLAGRKGFMRQRTFATFKDGIDAGLVPVSTNPADMFVLKYHEMLKFLKAAEIAAELKEKGLSKYVKSGHQAPDGYAKVNDSMFTVFGGPDSRPQGGKLIRGEYYLPEPAARVLNNYLSPGLRGNTGFRGYMFLANTLNQVQLGLSAFHLGFVTVDASTSKLSLALNQMASGQFLEGAGSVARSNPITAPLETLYRGSRMLQEARTPGSQDTKYAEAVAAHQMGGGRFQQERVYTNEMVRKMKTAWRDGNVLGAAIRAPFAAIEKASEPVMRYTVPRMKLGVAYDLYRMEIQKNPNIDQESARILFSKVVDSVDNRLGQMVYDNLFWHRAAKDIAHATVRSVGWNLGTFRELGGGATDVFTKTLRGKGLSYRTSYLIALPIWTAMLGSIIHYLYNGKGPEELKDAYFPRTGATDERGNPERVSLPSYIKDIVHYQDLWRVGPKSRRTLINKLHPLLGYTADMLQNQDYFGVEIYNEDDPLGQKLKDIARFTGKQFLPYGIQNVAKERERGSSFAKSIPAFFGLTPAPADINQTAAEEEMYNIEQTTRPEGSKTRAQSDRYQALFKIRQAAAKHDFQKAQTLATQARESGLITPKDIEQTFTNAQTPEFQRRFEQLHTPEERLKVWKKANTKERQEALPVMLKTLPKLLELPPAQQKDLLGRYKTALKPYTQTSP